MTEKLTYNPTPADAPELTEDEQNSLEVADKLGQEEAKQYAGKFDNADQLEKAYLELQKKLGSPDEDTEVDTVENDQVDEEVSPGVALITDASNEYYNNEGKLSQETMEKFSEMSSQDLVNAFVEIQKNAPAPQGEAADLTDAEMNQVYNSAGGEKAYETMVKWAGENLAEKKLDAFNSIVNQGDATAIQIAVAGLKSEYENAVGYEGRMLSGKAARSSGDVFRSQAELVAAMNDPRYEKDPAYQQDVYDKLERSNVQF
tara:strand:- start:20 stop:796 length:777 start_codon:yes stop_codon:yes gene_type:complete